MPVQRQTDTWHGWFDCCEDSFPFNLTILCRIWKERFFPPPRIYAKARTHFRKWWWKWTRCWKAGTMTQSGVLPRYLRAGGSVRNNNRSRCNDPTSRLGGCVIFSAEVAFSTESSMSTSLSSSDEGKWKQQKQPVCFIFKLSSLWQNYKQKSLFPPTTQRGVETEAGNPAEVQ